MAFTPPVANALDKWPALGNFRADYRRTYDTLADEAATRLRLDALMAQLDLYSFVSAHASLRAIKLAAGRNGPVAAIKQQIQRLPESEVRVHTE